MKKEAKTRGSHVARAQESEVRVELLESMNAKLEALLAQMKALTTELERIHGGRIVPRPNVMEELKLLHEELKRSRASARPS